MPATNYTVSTTATQLVVETTTPTAQVRLLIKHWTGGVVYLGDDDSVTAASGYPFASGEELDLQWRGALWGIIEAGQDDADVRVFRLLLT